jgi:hypothetical protein
MKAQMGLGEGALSAPHPGHFTPAKETRLVPVVLVAGWGLRVGLGGSGRSLSPTGVQMPNHPARSKSLCPLSYPQCHRCSMFCTLCTEIWKCKLARLCSNLLPLDWRGQNTRGLNISLCIFFTHCLMTRFVVFQRCCSFGMAIIVYGANVNVQLLVMVHSCTRCSTDSGRNKAIDTQ